MSHYQTQFIQALLAYAAQRGVAPARLCALSGMHLTDIASGHVPLTAPQQNSLWKNAAQLTDDPLFGLHFGESMQLAALGLIGQLILTSHTVGDALSLAGPLSRHITNMFEVQVNTTSETFALQLITDEAQASAFPYTYQHIAHYLLAFALHELDGLTLQKMTPLRMQLPRALGDHVEEYARIFRCSWDFTDGTMGITFPISYLSQPIITADYELQQVLLQQVQPLRPPRAVPSFKATIYHYLMANAYLCVQSLDAVASNFTMSPRTLQRKLQQEGTTFFEIADEVKKHLAMRYLQNAHYQVKDIAYTLGYNDPSAFLRAFKRWTGQTPAAYRTTVKKS